MENMNNSINHHDLIDSYRILHPAIGNYTFSLNVY